MKEAPSSAKSLDVSQPEKEKSAVSQETINAAWQREIDMRREIKETLELFDPVNRRGAGDVKVGVPGFRPSGKRLTDSFYEKFTETGKLPEKKIIKPDYSTFLGTGKAPQGPKVRIAALPVDFCPDCGKKGIPPEKRSLNISPIFEKWEAMNLRVGDILRHIICSDCLKKARHEGKNGLMLASQNMMIPYSVHLAMTRGKRIKQNCEDYARYLWNSRQEGVFIDEHGENMNK